MKVKKTEKQCRLCGIVKLSEEFYQYTGKFKLKSGAISTTNRTDIYCKECRKLEVKMYKVFGKGYNHVPAR